jgi:hypothetical protein
MNAAAQAIMHQADEILVKPMDLLSLVQIIRQRVANGPQRKREIETVASILERTTEAAVQEWNSRVEMESTLMSVRMSREERCAHLPVLFRELVARLRSDRPIGASELASTAATQHGIHRFRHGYTASMLVEESRILQVSIFNTLQNNLVNIDYNVLLIGVMTIADEIDFQLGQAMSSFTEEALHAASWPGGSYAR